MAKQLQCDCHDTLPWLIPASLDAMRVLMPIVLFAAAAVAADEQHSRPFDNYRAIFAVCVSSFNVEWTSEARKYVLNEVNRRAAREKLLVSIDNNIDPDKFCEAHGLSKDQVIWLVMTFEDSSAYKGGVNFTLNANNARLYLQGAVFDPGISFAKAKPTLNQMLDWFFGFGEGKYHLTNRCGLDKSAFVASRTRRSASDYD